MYDTGGSDIVFTPEHKPADKGLISYLCRRGFLFFLVACRSKICPRLHIYYRQRDRRKWRFHPVVRQNLCTNNPTTIASINCNWLCKQMVNSLVWSRRLCFAFALRLQYCPKMRPTNPTSKPAFPKSIPIGTQCGIFANAKFG